MIIYKGLSLVTWKILKKQLQKNLNMHVQWIYFPWHLGINNPKGALINQSITD